MLKEAILLEKKIRYLRGELQEIRLQFGEIVKPLNTDGGGRSNLPSDPVGDLASEVLDDETKIVRQIQQLRKKKRDIRNMIEEKCLDPFCQEVLMRRYIRFQEYEMIADEMFTSQRNMFKLRKKGIQEITRRMNNA